MSGQRNDAADLPPEEAAKLSQEFLEKYINTHAKKILEQSTPENKRIMLEEYITGTRIMRKGMDDKGLRQVAERYAVAMVKLFAAWMSRNEDPKVQATMLELAADFNKGAEPKEESKIILLNK